MSDTTPTNYGPGQLGPDGRPIDEAVLAASAAGGDEEALSKLLETFGPIVRDRLKGKIGQQWRSALDEDDVMQVTYLEAFLLIDQFKPRGDGSFTAWLSQVAENNLRDALRGLQAAKGAPRDHRPQKPSGRPIPRYRSHLRHRRPCHPSGRRTAAKSASARRDARRRPARLASPPRR
ncbi:MAG: sigma factor, partial [Planctomycetota bacterium]